MEYFFTGIGIIAYDTARRGWDLEATRRRIISQEREREGERFKIWFVKNKG